MAMTDVLAQIDAEIAKLEQVKVLLSGAPAVAAVKRGRPKGAKTAAKVAEMTAPAKAPTKKTQPKRILSAEARAKIAAAQKARWAAARGNA